MPPVATRQLDENSWGPVFLVRTIRSLKDALFPVTCLTCGCFYARKTDSGSTVSGAPSMEFFLFESYEKVFQILLASHLCPDCVLGFSPVRSPLCPSCGIMFRGGKGDDHVCQECIRSSRRFHKARAVGVYEDRLVDVVRRFKYDGKIQLARPLEILMFMAFIRHWADDPVHLVLPVPLHGERLRKRGFNQAYLLIKDWPILSAKSHLPDFEYQVEKEILQRSVKTKSQTGLNREQRRINLRGAFTVKDPAKIFGKRVLVVDDVNTTGTTINECAHALLDAGADRVDALTLAKAL